MPKYTKKSVENQGFRRLFIKKMVVNSDGNNGVERMEGSINITDGFLKSCNHRNPMEQAIENAHGLVRGTIHHSERGLQYCSGDYVKLLQNNQMNISMTENGDPYENAVAERINGILKDEWLYEMQLKNKNQTLDILNQIIALYNETRPHLSLNYQTPDMVYNRQKERSTITPLKCKPQTELKNVLVNHGQD